MKYVRGLLAWILFGLGDLVSRPMNYSGFGWLYLPYNWLMSRSSDLQVGDCGPWRACKSCDCD